MQVSVPGIMDSRMIKYYHVDGFNPTTLLDAYFSPKTTDCFFQESTKSLMSFLHKAFASGFIKGKTLIDISLGPTIFQLLPVYEFFEKITILEFHDFCIKELEKWKNKDADAFDWTHTLTIMAELKGISDGWQEREDLLRSKVKQIVKCDFSKYNPTDPVLLPKASCVMCIWGLDIISKDKDTYCKNLKKISSLVKLQGFLIIYGAINASYFMIGDHKYHLLTYDDHFLRMALSDEGFKIEYYEDLHRTTTSDLVDLEKIVFIVAQKVCED
ncbi:nicotinamide N-methyltransferase-like [Mixophyes fleayi]|uniref:nicotinamide N-methyltransferase-like n=1 Tax=Mixophyes fleayi TaxID=3061075 RepID=UPI003F4DFCA3